MNKRVLIAEINEALTKDNVERLKELISEIKKFSDEDVESIRKEVDFSKQLSFKQEYSWGTSYTEKIFDLLAKNNLLTKEELNEQLLKAIEIGREEIAKSCLDNGADVNYMKDGKTPLLVAISEHKQKNYKHRNGIIKLLVENGADLSYGNPIKEAIKAGDPDLIAYLVKNGEEHPKELEEVLKSPIYKMYRKARKLPKEYRQLFQANKESYGYESLKEKIGNKIADIDIRLGVASTALGALVLFPLGVSAHAINYSIVDGNLQNANEQLENKRIELGQTVANKVDLSNFDIASVELAQGENNYILKAFGSTSAEQIVGLKENNYMNVFFNISNEQAYNILSAVARADSTDRINSYNSPEHSNTIGEINDMYFSESARIGGTLDACLEVYSALNNAVNNAYSYEMENISEASAMNNSISREYRYTRPDVVGDTNGGGIFTHVSTTFVNTGVVTTGISQVVKDEEKGVSYFLIDTLQGRAEDGDMTVESCRARVEVEGTDLTQEEVYAKFINGEHSSFTEIVREKVGSKTGVVNNEINDNVEEIELF